MKHHILRTAVAFLLLSAFALAQDVASFEKRITVKKAAQRPHAPDL